MTDELSTPGLISLYCNTFELLVADSKSLELMMDGGEVDRNEAVCFEEI